jgi:hypothetical protein
MNVILEIIEKPLLEKVDPNLEKVEVEPNLESSLETKKINKTSEAQLRAIKKWRKKNKEIHNEYQKNYIKKWRDENKEIYNEYQRNFMRNKNIYQKEAKKFLKILL